MPVERTRTFLECLAAGQVHPDDCPASLAAYRDAIDQLTARIEELTAWRAALAAQVREAAHRGSTIAPDETSIMTDLTRLPPDLPKPEDDGAADHLIGQPMPHLTLATATGDTRS
jgi:hypothetical protein